jgi:fucose 4-O-acetylase-like acetyltransferase
VGDHAGILCAVVFLFAVCLFVCFDNFEQVGDFFGLFLLPTKQHMRKMQALWQWAKDKKKKSGWGAVVMVIGSHSNVTLCNMQDQYKQKDFGI